MLPLLRSENVFAPIDSPEQEYFVARFHAVEYFVSYYDYYQPEAYVPSTRHLHREGRLDQRAHRADAPLGDQGAARAPGRRSSSRPCRPSTASAIPQAYLQHGAAPRPRRPHRPARPSCGASRSCSTRATSWSSHRGTLSACAATSSTSSRRSRSTRRCASSCSTTRSRRSALFDPLTGEVLRKVPRLHDLSRRPTTSPRARRCSTAVEQIRVELKDRLD